MLSTQPLQDSGLPQPRGFWPQGPTWFTHLPWPHSQTQSSQQGRGLGVWTRPVSSRLQRLRDMQGETDAELSEPGLLRVRLASPTWAGAAGAQPGPPSSDGAALCPLSQGAPEDMATRLPSELGSQRHDSAPDSLVS